MHNDHLEQGRLDAQSPESFQWLWFAPYRSSVAPALNYLRAEWVPNKAWQHPVTEEPSASPFNIQ